MRKMFALCAAFLGSVIACLPVAAEPFDGSVSIPTPAGSADPFATIVFAVCLLVAGAVVIGAIAVLRKKGREAAEEMDKDTSEENTDAE